MKIPNGPWGCIHTSNHAHDYRLQLPLNVQANDHSEQRAIAKAIDAVPFMIDALAMIMKHALQAQTQPEFAKDQAQEIEALALGALKKAGVA